MDNIFNKHIYKSAWMISIFGWHSCDHPSLARIIIKSFVVSIQGKDNWRYYAQMNVQKALRSVYVLYDV